MKLIGIIGLLVILSVAMGCGSSDLLDEVATQYSAAIYPVDNDEQRQDIDVVQDLCGTTTDEDTGEVTYDYEEFSPFDVDVVIESDDDSSAAFYVESYTVRFRPNHGSVGDEQKTSAQMPDLTGTTLNPITYSISSGLIEPGSSTTLSGWLVWTQGDKVVYAGIVADLFGTVSGTFLAYDFQIVLHCRTSGDETFEITTPWTPVQFSNFDNCG
jgi:hypothetical protein